MSMTPIAYQVKKRPVLNELKKCIYEVDVDEWSGIALQTIQYDILSGDFLLKDKDPSIDLDKL